MKHAICFVATKLIWAVSAQAASVGFYNDDGYKVTQILVGERVAIQVEGLQPKSRVTIRCGRGSVVSLAEFIASSEGSLDLSHDAPVKGTYSGVDPDGMWWSRADKAAPSIGTEADPFTCIVEDGSGELGRGSLARVFSSEGVTAQTLSVAKDGLMGRFAHPPGNGPFPTLVLLGGSEGGLSFGPEAEYFASKGYATLALAYFAAEGLPANLDRIPLEYFAKALDWLKSQPSSDSLRIGVIGDSRGGELALLLGSNFPQIKAVVSIVGSGLVWAGGFDEQSNRQTSSWTWRGKDIPFIPFSDEQPDKLTLPDGRVVDDIASVFVKALKDPAPQAAATIEVEHIRGPILFLGGSDDHIWLSCKFGEMVSERLKMFTHPYQDEFHCYYDAGHLIGMPGLPTTDLTVEHPVFHDLDFFGGTPEGTAHAQRESWTAILNFIKKM